jgi:hypothetical protein
MTTYDNLNIATTTLVFQGSGNTSVASGIFDLSSLAFLPNIPLIDQIEVERVFDTGYDTKFGNYSFTIANRREMFIFPKNWYSINEQTKVLTFKDLSTIPLYEENGLYYPYSRSYDFPSGPNLDIPTVQATSSQVGGITRQADIVYIRRKTPSINSIVTFAPGTRLTTTQLNLQFDQLKFNIQELVAKFRNEAILKYDENAVDGPFLGQGDLKMNNNYIKDVNSPAFTLYNQNIIDSSGLSFSANTFLVNLGAVASGIINGTLHRTGLNSSPPVFSGDYDAGTLKLINLANGSSAQDAATMGQISNASNITTGTLNPALFTDATIPLEKLSASRVTYTLPEAALPSANSLSVITPYGSATATNTNNIIYASVDPKGRITSVGHRNLAAGDLPNTTVTANTYGSANTKVPQITIDAQGRITLASDRTLAAADITTVNANAVSGVLTAGNLPAVSAGGGGATTVTSIPNSITVDTLGRVTAVSGGSITASNVSDFNTAVQTSKLNQMAAPIANVTLNSQKIINLGAPVDPSDAATRGYVDTNFTSSANLTGSIDTRLTTNAVYLSAAGILNAGGKPITNVGATTNANDVVTKSYLEANAIYATGANLSAGTKYLTDLIMRPSGSLSANDAVNFGYIETAILNAGGQQLVGTSSPQVFKQTWASANAISANTPATTSYIRYQFNFVDPTNVLYATSATMMLVEGTGGTRIFTPNIANATASGANAVYDGYFWLDTSGGATKVLNVYVNATPTGDITIRNFGLSRIVAGGTATESATGLVSIVPGTEGGISVSGAGAIALRPATSSQIGGIKLGSTLSTSSGLVNVVFPIAGNTTLGQVMVDVVANSGLSLNTGTGALSLPTASTTQLGGVKIDTTAGLTNTSGLISVTRSDSTSSNSTTTLANSKAVSDLKGLSMLLDGTQTMTGKLKTFASTASVASLNVPSGVAVTTRTTGDIWNLSGSLQFSPDGTAVKTLAYLDSSITGNAATATALTPGGAITLTGAVTSSATTFTGSAISIATTLAAGQAVTAVTGAGANAITATRTIDSVALTLPQNIGTSSDVQFGTARLGNITLGTNTINTATGTGNLIIDSAGGTTTINDTVSIAGPLTVTGSNATTLGGAVTLSSTLALSNAPCKIALGNTAGAALTSINSAGDATGANQIGDIILRTPANGRAFLVGNAANTTLTAENDAIITKGVMNSAIAGLSSTYMSITGGNAGANSQIFGSALGNFIVTGSAGATSLQISPTGTAVFANQVTISQGGLAVNSGGISVNGASASTIAGGLVITSTGAGTNGVITAALAPSQGSHLTNKTYVDGAIDSISDTNANITLKKLLMQIPIRQYVVGGITSGDSTTPLALTTSGMTVNVPKYFPINLGSGGFRASNLTVLEGHQIIILEQIKTSGTTTFNYTKTQLFGTASPIAEMLACRLDYNSMNTTGTFNKTSIGSILTGDVGGTTYQLHGGGGAVVELILMRIA